MALIKCSDCGKKVSDSVSSCPNCGNNIKKQLKKEKEIQNQEILTTILCTKCYNRVNKYADKCPKCGNDLSEAKAQDRKINIIVAIVFGVIVISVIWFIVAVVSAPESPESKVERAKYIECYNRSDTYYKCDWATLEDRCVCKRR